MDQAAEAAKGAARQPVWAWLVAGILGGSLVARNQERAPRVPPACASELSATALDLEQAGVRALRRLPAIGDRRANAIVRARWEHDPADGPLLLDGVRGIGDVTRDGVAAALGARRARPTQPVPLAREDLVLRRAAQADP